jgi:hypothetical protein
MLQSGQDTDLDMAGISNSNRDLLYSSCGIIMILQEMCTSLIFHGSCEFWVVTAVVEDFLLLGYDTASPQKNIILILDYHRIVLECCRQVPVNTIRPTGNSCSSESIRVHGTYSQLAGHSYAQLQFWITWVSVRAHKTALLLPSSNHTNFVLLMS